eukprot:2097437-Prymnesium_polylepis.2
MAADTIALVGALPAAVQAHFNRHKVLAQGVYTKRSELVNGRPSYVNVGDDELLWWDDNGSWVFGRSKILGQDVGWVKADHDVPQPGLVPRGRWQAADGKAGWAKAPDLHVLHCVVPADPDVA